MSVIYVVLTLKEADIFNINKKRKTFIVNIYMIKLILRWKYKLKADFPRFI